MSKIFRSESARDLQRIINSLRDNPGSTLIIAPGVYEITSVLAKQTQHDVMNGVYGNNPEKAMFNPSFAYSKGLDFNELRNITVEAQGVTLLINGFMEPVSITRCVNLTIKGLNIDHKRKPYSKAIIKKIDFIDIASGSGIMTVEFGPEYPVGRNTPMPRVCIFDCRANRFSHYGEARFDLDSRKELSAQVWQFPFCNLFEDATGNELYAWHTFHSRPAVLIENSKDICLKNISIHSQPGMGIVAHRCENLYFDRLQVVPSCGEHMSTNTDATHITSCKGTVEYNSCRFEGQGDDTVNIHTYYHTIEQADAKACRLVLDSPTGTHSQTADYPDKGDTLELTDAATLDVIDEYEVISCENLDSHRSEITVNKPLPQNCKGMYFADASRQPYFYFHDCVCRSHLARSVLSKTKYAQIEDNLFVDVVGTAICVLAEGHWREGICSTNNIAISRNRISYCGRTNSIRQGHSAGITVSLCAEKPLKSVHKNVIITDNIIDCPDAPHGIYVSNTDNLTLERNSIVSKDEPVKIEKFAEPDV